MKTKHKGRKHTGELCDALAWTRVINDVLDDIDGLSGSCYVSVEFVPSSDLKTSRDDFDVRFLGAVLFSTHGEEPFDSKEVENELYRELDHAVRNLTLHRRVLKAHLKK